MTPAGADIAEGYHLFSKNSYARFGPGSQAFNVRFLRIRTKPSPETAELTPDSLIDGELFPYLASGRMKVRLTPCLRSDESLERW
jgi:hypothetical protein